jgi:hypothetical protein
MAMNHEQFETLLPLYTAGQLNGPEQARIEAHLNGCAECQADLELWQAVSAEVRRTDRALIAPPALAEQALERLRRPGRLMRAVLHTWQLLRAQTGLVQREMWPASASVIALGVALALVSNHLEVVYFLAPMIAAAMLAMLFGQENDPVYELAAATPTSPWKVLLARMSIVSAYNFLLTLAATLVLLAFAPPGLLGALAFGWLAPMAFLSTLALLLSVWFGSGNAIVIAYALWVAQYIPYQSLGRWLASPTWAPVIAAYRQFWQTPQILLVLTVLLLGITLVSVNRPVFRMNQETL